MKLVGRILLSVMGALLGTMVAVWWMRYRQLPLLPDRGISEPDPADWIALD